MSPDNISIAVKQKSLGYTKIAEMKEIVPKPLPPKHVFTFTDKNMVWRY